MISVYSKTTKKYKSMINTELDSEAQVACDQRKRSTQRRASTVLIIFYYLSWKHAVRNMNEPSNDYAK